MARESIDSKVSPHWDGWLYPCWSSRLSNWSYTASHVFRRFVYAARCSPKRRCLLLAPTEQTVSWIYVFAQRHGIKRKGLAWLIRAKSTREAPKLGAAPVAEGARPCRTTASQGGLFPVDDLFYCMCVHRMHFELEKTTWGYGDFTEHRNAAWINSIWSIPCVLSTTPD